MTDAEKNLRDALKIPAGAQRILIFGESSHWDPNWLLKAEEYFRWRVRKVLDRALAELEADKQRIFGVECIFFLKMYWERFPHRQEAIRRLVNEGRLRLLGGGMTTPDTLLPEEESLIRDYLLGARWLKSNDMHQQPAVAYFPDSFGHSPALPSLLNAMGFQYAAITRIDGMYFPAGDYRLRSFFPVKGSSAELLEKELRTSDFIWQSAQGGEVICHWNPFTYFQGDLLAYKGIVRVFNFPTCIRWRTDSHVASRIEAYVRQLSPLAKTPYLFCPIGLDFNAPIPALGNLLNRYNENHFHRTGIYAMNAGIDDYLKLVSFHRERLPVISLDPNPYWMGFYASRPEAKQRCRRLVQKLLALEGKTVEDGNADGKVQTVLQQAWETAAVSNHHDFITGTSPDRVWYNEQRTWLVEAERLVDEHLPPSNEETGSAVAPEWKFESGVLHVKNSFYEITIDESKGCAWTSWKNAAGKELLKGMGNDIIFYQDSGGLWRMGHELRGGKFSEVKRASGYKGKMNITEDNGILKVTCDAEHFPTRYLEMRNDSPMIRLAIEGKAERWRTVCCSFDLAFKLHSWLMDVPGGLAERPLKKIYDPTFWSANHFAQARDEEDNPCMSVMFESAGCISATDEGRLQWVVLRNATLEKAFGFLPVPVHPALGTDNDTHLIHYAVTSSALPVTQLRNAFPGATANAFSKLFTLSGNAEISAVKYAADGKGIIVRIRNNSFPDEKVVLTAKTFQLQAAFLCDALERDKGALEVNGNRVIIPTGGYFRSVRVIGSEISKVEHFL